MNTTLRHTQYQFTLTLLSIKPIALKPSARFYISWKITHDNTTRQIVSDQYIQCSPPNELHFSNPLQVLVKIIYNKETRSFLGKKSMLCLNYILDENLGESVLGGMVTVDLAGFVGGEGGMGKEGKEGRVWEYGLERTVWKEARVYLKCDVRKIREEVMESWKWEGKDLSVDSIFNKTSEGKDKKVINTRKNINKIIKDKDTTKFFSNPHHLQSLDIPSNRSETHSTSTSLPYQQLQLQYNKTIKKVLDLQKQNNEYKEKQKQIYHRKVKTLEKEYRSSEMEEGCCAKCNGLGEEKKYVLSELEKVSLQLANREKEMVVLKGEYDKLRRREKKREMEREKQKSEDTQQQDTQQQVYYLTSEIMRLHQELANYREVEIQNNDLRRQKESTSEKLNQLTLQNTKSTAEIQRLLAILSQHSTKPLPHSSPFKEQISNKPIPSPSERFKRASSELHPHRPSSSHLAANLTFKHHLPSSPSLPPSPHK